jgi:predicted O-linked N-acetylglucosamine transferase (SPINDLY family)
MVMSNAQRHQQAIELINRAIRIQPSASLYFNLGNILATQQEYDAAAESFTHAIKLNPAFAEAYTNLGNTQSILGQDDAALHNCQYAITLNPTLAAAHTNLGNALLRQGQYAAASDSFRQVIALTPQSTDAYTNFLFSLCFDAESTPEQYLKEARRAGEAFLAQASPYTTWNNAESHLPKLKIGFVSGDLRTHPVGYFFESIISHLNLSRLELVAYHTQSKEDELTDRLKKNFSHWHSLVGLNNADAAKKIHDDGIHILIDLAGHTALNRLPIFAWKPAPVQISWLGYFASTGLSGIDYLFADSISVPAADQAHFIEKIWYLPETRLCFTPPAANIKQELTPLPALHNGYITFGCFQRLNKINDHVLEAWGQIFRQLPTARLKIKNKHISCTTTRNALLQRLSNVGITPERLILEGQSSREAYLATYADVDIMLDTFPFPGGTTTCEALWMGVPTLTLTGNTLLGRQGTSMLCCVGLQDWATEDLNDYISKAIACTHHINDLAQLRANLRHKMRDSALVDASRFARNFEQALHEIWQKRIKDQSAE